VTRLANPKCLARYPNTNAALHDQFDGHLLASGWPHHFYPRASDTISTVSFSLR
jgi:hypothetical protein